MAFNDTQPYISKVTLPSGNTYNIKDAAAREAIAALEGGSYFIGESTTPLTDQATTNPITVDGQSVTVTNGNIVVYNNAEFIWNGSKWIEFGDLSNLGALATKSNVTLNKGTGVNVVSGYSNPTTDKVLGSDATFTTTVTPTTTNVKATASGTAVGANGTAAAITGFGAHSTETFVKSVSADTTKKLVTTTVPNVTANTNVSIPNVTNVGTASTWAFAMGSGDNAETLVISGTNSTTPTLGTALSASKVTLGTAKTVATGEATTSGSGSAIVTDVTIGDSAAAITALGTPTTSNCLTGVKVTAQPTISLATGATAGTGVVSVATGITSATTTTNNKDEVTTITGLGTASTQKVAKYDDLSVSVS